MSEQNTRYHYARAAFFKNLKVQTFQQIFGPGDLKEQGRTGDF